MSEILSKKLYVETSPKQLPFGEPIKGILRVATPAANSGVITIVSNNEKDIGYEIAAGQYMDIMISEISKLWFWGTAADYLLILAEIKDRPQVKL